MSESDEQQPAMVAALEQLVAWQSHRMGTLPEGVTVEALAEAGRAVIPSVLEVFDPGQQLDVKTVGRPIIRAAMGKVVDGAKAKLKAARKATSPATVGRPTPQALSNGIARAAQEAAGYTGGRAELLRDAMLGCLSVSDAEAIARVLTSAAKAGDALAGGALVALLRAG